MSSALYMYIIVFTLQLWKTETMCEFTLVIFLSRILLMEMDCYTQESKVVSDIRLCWRSGGNLFIWVESFIRVLYYILYPTLFISERL